MSRKAAWIYPVMVTVIGVAVLMSLQWYRNDLAAQLEERANHTKGDDRESGRSSKSRANGQSSEREESDDIKNLQSKERANIDETRLKITSLTKAINAQLKGGADFLHQVRPILELIDGLSAKDLLLLREQLAQEASLDPTRANDELGGSLQRLLIAIAAEHDPLYVIQQELPSGQDLAFSSLLKADPAAAERWLEGADLPTNTRSLFERNLVTHLMRHDVAAGVEAIRRYGIPQRFSPFQMDDSQLNQLGEIYKDPLNKDLRHDLGKVYLESSYARKQDIASIRRHAESLGMEDEVLQQFFNFATQRAGSESPVLLQWMTKFFDKKPGMNSELHRLSRTMIQKWADQDYSAAAAWLDKGEDSPIHDSMLLGFSRSVIHIEPEAAVEWVHGIEQPELRERATYEMLEYWRAIDKEAAEAWAEKNRHESD